jgi:hypothetical protein
VRSLLAVGLIVKLIADGSIGEVMAFVRRRGILSSARP